MTTPSLHRTRRRGRSAACLAALGLVAAGLVPLVALGGLTALTASSASGVETLRPGRTAQVRVVTYNARHDVPVRRTVAEITRLGQRSRVDLIALQEMSSGRKRAGIRARLVTCRDCRWRGWFPSPAVPGATPMLWREGQYRLERTGSVQVSRATRVGGSGAGPAVLRAKYVNWVKLTERKTGRTVWLLNNHTVPSVVGDGGRPNRNHRARLRLYRQHMEGVTRLASRFAGQGGLVFAVGDFNVNYRTDSRAQSPLFPYARFGAIGMRASYRALGTPDRGTHVLLRGRSTRLIDYVHFLPRRGLKPVGQKVLRGFASDHRPLLVHFTLHRG